MTFEQTKIYQDLVKSFTKIANDNKYFTDKEITAKTILEGHAKIHGEQNIIKVAKKANQKAKCKFYSV